MKFTKIVSAYSKLLGRDRLKHSLRTRIETVAAYKACFKHLNTEFSIDFFLRAVKSDLEPKETDRKNLNGF